MSDDEATPEWADEPMPLAMELMSEDYADYIRRRREAFLQERSHRWACRKRLWEMDLRKASEWKRRCEQKEEEFCQEEPPSDRMLSRLIRRLAGINPRDCRQVAEWNHWRRAKHLDSTSHLIGGERVGYQTCNEENWERTVKAYEDG